MIFNVIFKKPVLEIQMKTVLIGVAIMLSGAWLSQYNQANIDKVGILTLGVGIGLIFGRSVGLFKKK